MPEDSVFAQFRHVPDDPKLEGQMVVESNGWMKEVTPEHEAMAATLSSLFRFNDVTGEPPQDSLDPERDLCHQMAADILTRLNIHGWMLTKIEEALK